jgi:hypothetical protein
VAKKNRAARRPPPPPLAGLDLSKVATSPYVRNIASVRRKVLFNLPPLPRKPVDRRVNKTAATTGARTLPVPLSGDRDD